MRRARTIDRAGPLCFPKRIGNCERYRPRRATCLRARVSFADRSRKLEPPCRRACTVTFRWIELTRSAKRLLKPNMRTLLSRRGEGIAGEQTPYAPAQSA